MRQRILILSTSLAGGGGEYVTRLMAERLKDSICFVFEDYLGLSGGGINVHVIPGKKRKTIAGKIIQNLARLLFIQGVKFRYRPSVTISHLEGPNLANLITVGGGKKVIFVHNTVSNNYRANSIVDSAKKFLIRVFYSKADRVVGVSLDVIADLIANFNVPKSVVEVIPNPVDAEQIIARAEKRYKDAKDVLIEERFIVNVASLTQQKNHDFLIKIYSKLREVDSTLKLVLIGKGDQEDSLVEACRKKKLTVSLYSDRELRLERDVFFLGFLENPYPFVSQSELVVMPSSWEGLPISLLEAMVLGKWIVISDCSLAIRKLMGQQEGEFEWTAGEHYRRSNAGVIMRDVRWNSLTHWVNAIKEMLDQKAAGLDGFSNASETVRVLHDIENVVPIWEQLVQDDYDRSPKT
jgi:N-acetylgalactosamine-N,N'-diacetylbacillosaminyl-diphospho-undecaprenol 4-alpha-N-acetylgalactosaminyltransferase